MEIWNRIAAKDIIAAILTVPSNNGGFDTVLTLINSAIDGILAGLGVAPGDSSVGQWTVYAYSGNDSLKAIETYNITLKRQAKGDVLVAYDSSVLLVELVKILLPLSWVEMELPSICLIKVEIRQQVRFLSEDTRKYSGWVKVQVIMSLLKKIH